MINSIKNKQNYKYNVYERLLGENKIKWMMFCVDKLHRSKRWWKSPFCGFVTKKRVDSEAKKRKSPLARKKKKKRSSLPLAAIHQENKQREYIYIFIFTYKMKAYRLFGLLHAIKHVDRGYPRRSLQAHICVGMVLLEEEMTVTMRGALLVRHREE